jgi:methylase of polypeptide subunit release factors
LTKLTGRSESALKKGLNAEIEDQLASRFRTVCQDAQLWRRVKPFAGLVRLDTTGYPVVITPGSVFVTAGTDRRSSGTHYTPRSLTEPIVQYTLEPLVFEGPAEGWPKSEWRLRSAKELLDLKVCDLACGSGAFLVEACRYLAARLQEAWQVAQRSHPDAPGITPDGSAAKGHPTEQIIPTDAEERHVYALRLVAQRCIYGVDKNPLAAEMAKLSLWLLTLAKDKPFEFLDHAIRCGDSLVGIHNLDQLRYFNLQASRERERPELGNLFLQFLDPRIQEAIELRRKLETMPANRVEDVQAQEQLLLEANEKMERLKCAADLLVGAEFTPGSAADKLAARDDAAIQVAVHFQDSDLATFQLEGQKNLNGQPTFHWPLEFPEVFCHRGHREHREADTSTASVPSVSSVAPFGFDAIVGNPPFMGGQKITGNLGNEYREYLIATLANGQRGSADLCAYFFLRARSLLRDGGLFGLLATNTIAQGDTREVGLDQLCGDGCVIPRAVPSRPWPGVASLEVAHVWVRRGTWSGAFTLDDKPTPGITPFLASPGTVSGKPYRLKANEGKSFQGSIVLGMGFVLTPEEAQALIAKDARNRDVLFPYLNGEDLNSRPDQSPSRWVINFFDWPIEKAMEYPDCFRIVEEKVKPERMKLMGRNSIGTKRAKQWWLYGADAKQLYRTIAGLEQVLVKSEVGNKLSFAVVANEWVFSHMLIVFSSDRIEDMALLQSSFHVVWSLQYGSTMRTDLRYTPSDCFETFPFPLSESSVPSVAKIGETYHTHRRHIMLARQEGLTRTYNRFHDPAETSADIQKLRQLHVEMDHAVAAAYGWTDLDLGHGFHETKQGTRYTISEAARREVLARLLKLNHERYAEEVAQGLHDKKKAKGKRRGTEAEAGGGLFG